MHRTLGARRDRKREARNGPPHAMGEEVRIMKKWTPMQISHVGSVKDVVKVAVISVIVS